MSINTKKYTKDQMAKMVEDAAERLKSQKKENEELAEQLKSQTAKTIALRNDLMAKMHSNAVLTDLAQYLNDQGQQYWRAWQASKREVADLKNKLNDTEAALGRANAEVSRVTVGCRQVEEERDYMHQQWSNAEQRANYAEAHPWRNLWAWVKRELGCKA